MCSKSGKTQEGLAIWRLDPKISFSDWTLQVVSDESTTDYHVHKNLMSLGYRKSEYFASVFRGDFSESNKSIVHFDEAAAKVVPDMLDYIYTGRKDVVKLSNVVEIYHLANYFGVQSLQQQAEDCMCWSVDAQDDDFMADFLRRALRFRDDFTMDFAIVRIATVWVDCCSCEKPLVVADYQVIIGILDVWNDMIRGRALFAKTPTNMGVESYILDWLHFHKESLDAEQFLNLVDEKRLPDIESGHVALKLLKLERELLGVGEDRSTLAKRAVHSLTTDCESFDDDEREELTALLGASSKSELFDILLACFGMSKSTRHEPQPDDHHHIVVKNAFESSMNGVFKLEGMHEGAYKYSKHGTWAGKCCRFIIYRDNHEIWNFGTLFDDDQNATVGNSTFCIYEYDCMPISDKVGCNESCDESKHPPMWHWMLSDDIVTSDTAFQRKVRETSGAISTPLLLFRPGSADVEGQSSEL